MFILLFAEVETLRIKVAETKGSSNNNAGQRMEASLNSSMMIS